MRRGKWSSLGSVIVSVMVSESQIYRCHELPEWSRWFWLLWSLLPEIAAQASRVPDRVAIGSASVWVILQADWLAGWGVIMSSFLPIGIATG